MSASLDSVMLVALRSAFHRALNFSRPLEPIFSQVSILKQICHCSAVFIRIYIYYSKELKEQSE